jgi:hypothetical protein
MAVGLPNKFGEAPLVIRYDWHSPGYRCNVALRPGWVIAIGFRISVPASDVRERPLLGCVPRSSEEAIIVTAESLMRLGLLRSSKEVAQAGETSCRELGN